ncbi:MAG: hypothetical protein M1839_000219 [Geoglossum umbratile]|nr:MAG: hypothetical protein M1839_000219 [Geoglossum umbratile]
MEAWLSPNISSAFSTVLNQPPSCLEFSPVATALFVVGTYYLEEQRERGGDDAPRDLVERGDKLDDGSPVPQSRSGSLVLYTLIDDSLQAVKIQALSTPSAVLDLHFSPHSPATFAIATSTGTICIYRLSTDTPSPAIAHDLTAKLFSASTLVLALAFHPTNPSLIAGSLSTGSVALTNPSTNTVLHLLPAHSLEAWTLAFSLTAVRLYSGGDDCALTQFYVDPNGQDPPIKSWSDRRSHTAGVTAILPLPVNERILLTGSYDEFVRIYDCGARRVLTQKKVAEGGGVWRLSLIRGLGNDQNQCLVLASCMHAGSRLLEIVWKEGQDGDWEIIVLGAFDEHQSMNYAGDVVLDRGGRGLVVVSTSFYDRLLCVWRFERPR